MIGRRRPDGNPDYVNDRQPGDYWRHTDGTWRAITPNGMPVNLADLAPIEEHDDGTITVTPSIQQLASSKKRYEGFLERGVWRESQ